MITSTDVICEFRCVQGYFIPSTYHFIMRVFLPPLLPGEGWGEGASISRCLLYISIPSPYHFIMRVLTPSPGGRGDKNPE